jgi:MATE family multidrug resistance protein
MTAVALEPAAPQASLRSLLALAWPVVLARATQSVIGFSDALMVAPLGEDALAAVTTGALNAFVLIILPMGTVFIVQSFAAQLRGRGQLDAVPRYAWYGLLLAGVAGLAALASLPAVPWMLDRFEYSPSVHALMSSYLAIRLLSVGMAVGMEALGNWYGGLGHTRPAMFAGLVAMVTNVAANYVLIEPRFGLPGYGVAGAAWASVLGSSCGFLTLLVPFLRGIGYEKAAGPLALRWSEVWRVIRFGLPNGVNWFLEFAAFMLFINVFVARLGTTALAAFSVVLQINSVAFMPAFGLASAGAIFVGEAIGRGARREVWPVVRLTGTVASAWMVTIGLIYVALPGQLMSLFGPDDVAAGDLVRVGTTMLMLSAVWQLFDALGLTLGEALRAAGDTAWCMAARIAIAWLVFMPAAWVGLGVLQGGIITVMVVVATYVLLIAVALGLRFASGRWKRIELVQTEPTLV